jgi:flavorubredoxin
MSASQGHPMPRELVPGVIWLGDCIREPWRGTMLHGYNSAYLVRGEDCSLLVEAGHPKDLPVLERQLEELLADGPPLRYIFCTHQETPHSSGIARVLRRHSKVELCGDVRDYHLFFPAYEDRFRPLERGESLDLGGTEFMVVEAVIRDLVSSQWGFDTSRRVLFPGDGFAYSHYHEAGMCGSTAEESPELALEEMTGLFAELALYWTRFTDMEPHVARLSELLRTLDVALIAPTHGLPIADPAATAPAIFEGLLAARGT